MDAALGGRGGLWRGGTAHNIEIDKRPFRSPDPVLLPLQNILRPARLDPGHVVQQLIGIRRRLKKPLVQIFLRHGIPATPAQTAARLLVRKRRLVRLTPVDLGHAFVRQAHFVHFQKEPLVEFVIFRTMRRHLPRPVIAYAQTLKLATHCLDILFGPLTRIHTAFDRRVLRRLAERIPPDRMQHIKAFKPLVPRYRVARRIIPHMPHMQVSRRIREHLKLVKLRLYFLDLGFESSGFGPFLLPLLFYLFCKILFIHKNVYRHP